MSRLLDIAFKDASVLLRDKASLLVLVAMPFALIFILGSAFGGLESGDIGIKVAIVNEDTGGIGDQFVTELTEAEGLDELFDITVSEDAAETRKKVEAGDLVAALIIPPDATERVSAGNPLAVEVLKDSGSEISANIWEGVIRAGVSHASAQIVVSQMTGSVGSSAPVGLPPGSTTLGGEGTREEPPSTQPAPALDAVTVKRVELEATDDFSYIAYYSAGMTAMFLLFGSMFGAFSFVTERREKTLDRMFVAPVAKLPVVLGKGLGIIMIGLGQLALLILGTKLVFSVDWGVHMGATFALGAAEVFAATGLAMALAAFGKTERAIGGLGPAAIMLFSVTSGAMFPVEGLPTWLRPLQLISPVYWTLGGFDEVMAGATLGDVAWRVGIVMLIGVVLYAIGVWRLRYE